MENLQNGLVGRDGVEGRDAKARPGGEEGLAGRRRSRRATDGPPRVHLLGL